MINALNAVVHDRVPNISWWALFSRVRRFEKAVLRGECIDIFEKVRRKTTSTSKLDTTGKGAHLCVVKPHAQKTVDFVAILHTLLDSHPCRCCFYGECGCVQQVYALSI